ncbi:hypothetical protein BU16DRAFT_536349 [Lophium mytilinum]|uniref:Uncharacterized protein n=1 Tax=Lophium mytilinum TaxID=390894 RepID=A0A6A6R309_9PEZI|nr:hypothetical protein BU16DRAFT_536349 [Lophium mytilinum]
MAAGRPYWIAYLKLLNPAQREDFADRVEVLFFKQAEKPWGSKAWLAASKKLLSMHQAAWELAKRGQKIDRSADMQNELKVMHKKKMVLSMQKLEKRIEERRARDLLAEIEEELAELLEKEKKLAEATEQKRLDWRKLTMELHQMRQDRVEKIAEWELAMDEAADSEDEEADESSEEEQSELIKKEEAEEERLETEEIDEQQAEQIDREIYEMETLLEKAADKAEVERGNRIGRFNLRD